MLRTLSNLIAKARIFEDGGYSRRGPPDAIEDAQLIVSMPFCKESVQTYQRAQASIGGRSSFLHERKLWLVTKIVMNQDLECQIYGTPYLSAVSDESLT